MADTAVPKRQKVTLVSSDGTEVGTAGNPIQITGGGGGVQYLENDTDASITGTAMMAEGAADALKPLQVDSSNNLKVVVNTALPAGTNAIGKLAANSGVDIGDVDITSIAAGDNNIGNVDVVSMPTTTVTATDLDIRNLSFTQDNTNVRGQALSYTPLQITASGDTTLVDPTASQQVYLYKVHLANSHATTAVTAGLKFTGGSVFNKVYLPAAGGQTTIHFLPNYLAGGTNNNLIVNLSAAGQVEATAYYIDGA